MRFIFIILLGIVVSGCASKRENMALSDKFKSNPSALVITEIAGFENPQYYVDEKTPAANSGSILLDGLFSMVSAVVTESSSASGKEAVNCIDASVILEDDYFKPFTTSLLSKGFTVQQVEPIKLNDLKEYEKKEEYYAPFDFGVLKNRHNAKYAIVLQPNFFGAKHSGCFSNPLASTIISVYAVDLDSNILEGYFKTAVEIKIQDNWEEKDYQGFVKTTVEALEKALQQAHAFLFAEKQPANS